MSNTKIPKKELVALLAANYQELSAVFEQLPVLKKHKNAAESRQQVLDALKKILEDYGVNPNDSNLYEIFKSDFSV